MAPFYHNEIKASEFIEMNRVQILSAAVTLVSASVSAGFAATMPGTMGDGDASIYYVASTGELGIQADGEQIGMFDIQSASGIFTAAATMPLGGLGLEINTSSNKAWVSLVANGFMQDFSLGIIAPPNLPFDFLLNDLTALIGRGFGAEKDSSDLILLCCTPLIPRDANLGDRARGALIDHFFATTGDPPFTWSNLTLTSSLTPEIAPTLSESGQFRWNSAGSALGNYSFQATVTNATGSAIGSLTVRLVPEPATMSVPVLTLAGMLVSFWRSR
jgi:hypothetical protein